MNSINILFTAVGFRGYLIEYFKNELKGNGNVFVTNSIEPCSGFIHAKKSFLVPNSSDRSYIPKIIEICKKYNINFIISLHDIDTYYISKSKKNFDEIKVKLIMPKFEIVNQCLDKKKYNKFTNMKNLFLPIGSTNKNEILEMISKKIICYPLIIKPRFGFGSNFNTLVGNKKELLLAWNFLSSSIIRNKTFEACDKEESLIIQELIEGQEYGLDIINDLEGNFIGCSFRKKYLMKSGETFAGKLENSPSEIIEFSKKFSKHSNHYGIVDIDLIFSKNKKKFFLLDINPRFGGGYPISHESGLNVPKLIIKLAKGEEIDEDLFKTKDTKNIILKDFKFRTYTQNNDF